jgi:hypothetical protein
MQSFLISLFLFFHVMGAIITFGPTFIFPIIASRAQKEPRHAHFASEVSHFIASRVVLPGAIIQGITGLTLFFLIGVDITSPPWRWLGIGIVLYLIAITISVAYQAPAAQRMVELTAAAGGPPGGVAGAGGPPAGGPPPGGPPPELVATGKRLQRGGQTLGLLIVLIVILMVTKPTIG